MLRNRNRWRLPGAGVVAGVLIAGGAGLAASASAASVSPNTAPAGAVSSSPAAGTPALEQHTKPDQFVKQFVQCGGTMYAVGRFSDVVWNGTTYPRENVFSFSATSPYTVSPWAPNVNGETDTIALSPDCSQAYIGGEFDTVGGASANHIAAISTATGALDTAFAHNANSHVETLALTATGHLLAGGAFTKINGSTNPYFTSLNPTTGADDGFLRLGISGTYHYCLKTHCSVHWPTQIYKQQISHGGTLDLAEGVFTTVSGQARQQIFMINLATSPASLTAWTSPEFDGSKGNLPGGYPYQCALNLPFYLRAATWSPNDQTIYTGQTGFKPYQLPGGTYPRSGLCDAVAAWPATTTGPVTHLWVDYAGCDSFYSIAADSAAIYAAGHPRWAENSVGCNFQGTGGIPDFGLWGLTPTTGDVILNSGGHSTYSMSRANADNMLVTSAGLWIGSTNRFGMDICGHVAGHAGICFLPYPRGGSATKKP